MIAGALPLLGMVAFIASPANAAFPGSNGRIAYTEVSQAGDDSEIYSVLPDGSDPRALTDTPADELDPSWSADGEWIAYSVADGTGGSAIWIMDQVGGNAHKIATSRINASPSFSASGDRVVFADARGIASVAVTGGNRDLLVKAKSGGSLQYPQYSPNGRRIVFSGRPKGASGKRGGIWTMRSDGSRLRRLTRSPAFEADDEPDYSPDGRQIVFVRHPTDSPRGAQVILMSSDGSDKRRVPGGLDFPAYAPAGDRLVGNSISAALDGCTDLFTLQANGLDRQPVTHNCDSADQSGQAYAASWQPLP